MIQVTSVHKTLGSKPVLKDLSFTINPHEIVGFLGPNGAGKTTTMRILTGFYLPDSGKVEIEGYNLEGQTLEVKKNIGYLPENNPLWEDLEVAESLELLGNLHQLSPARITSQKKNLIERCALGNVLGKKVQELSKGYRQRLGLALALIHDPKVLILDEPSTGLDPHQIIEIRSLIKELGKEKTVLLSSHILPEVQALCSRVLVLHQGSIVASGSPEELAHKAQGVLKLKLKIEGNKADIEHSLLQKFPVKELKHLSSEENWHRYEMSVSPFENLGENIFNLVLEKGWKLSELGFEENSLEDIFLSLTASPLPLNHL
ncbi:MAG: ATP-binding cassette domain-containing protein [Deltaproteobacteria bacterium]|nr:ATP-binding cassette domain-containing protein [Deltaproteobacteria bacterium]